jgi:fumarate reductase subunit D
MKIFFNLKIHLNIFSRIFQEYSRNISQKVVTKVILKKMWLVLSHLHPLVKYYLHHGMFHFKIHVQSLQVSIPTNLHL